MKAFETNQFILEIELDREYVTDFNRYPYSLPVINNLDKLELHPKVTFFVGENGSGKSTLLEAIAVACGFNPEGGSRNFRFNTRASHSSLYENLMIRKGITKPKDGYFLRAESFFNVATEIEQLDKQPAAAPAIIGAYGGKSLHEQSHGESFLALLVNRFFGNGLYILDEPEAALSPMRQMTVLSRIHELTNKGSQFIIATHSPIIMAYPNAQIYTIDEKGIHKTRYEDTEHYIVNRQFALNYHVMLRELLE